MAVKVVVVVALQPHVDVGEVVGQLPAEEVLLPVGDEVWAQALVVEVVVVQVPLPERGPVASHGPQAAAMMDPHKMGSISGQGVVAVPLRLRVLTMMVAVLMRLRVLTMMVAVLLRVLTLMVGLKSA